MPSTLSRAMSEADLQAAIIEYAQLKGWLVHAERSAWTSKGYRTPIQGDKGFPDLVLARKNKVVFVECKSEKGELTGEQHNWYMALSSSRYSYIWRPSDWLDGTVQRILE
jgi:hypothetical protein